MIVLLVEKLSFKCKFSAFALSAIVSTYEWLVRCVCVCVFVFIYINLFNFPHFHTLSSHSCTVHTFVGGNLSFEKVILCPTIVNYIEYFLLLCCFPSVQCNFRKITAILTPKTTLTDKLKNNKCFIHILHCSLLFFPTTLSI